MIEIYEAYLKAYLRNTCTNTNIPYKIDINQTEQVLQHERGKIARYLQVMMLKPTIMDAICYENEAS